MAVLFVSCGGGGNDSDDYAPVETPQVESIEISPKNVKLHRYETMVLIAKLYPEGAEGYCSWYVGDPSVSWRDHRDSLFITAEHDSGEADVILSVGQLTDTCHVTIIDEPVAIQNFTFEKTELELYEGESSGLMTNVFPAFATDSLNLRIEEQEIAKAYFSDFCDMRNGLRWLTISAEKPGSTYVIATTKDEKVVTKCKVTVKGLEQINLDMSEMELYKDQEGHITATVLPEKVIPYGLIWSIENEDIAYVYKENVDANTSKVRVVGRRTGTTNVVATSSDGNVVAKCKVTVKNNNQIDYHPYDEVQW